MLAAPGKSRTQNNAHMKVKHTRMTYKTSQKIQY